MVCFPDLTSSLSSTTESTNAEAFQRSTHLHYSYELLSLRHRPDHVRDGVVCAFTGGRSQADFLPVAGFQQPLVCWACDVAAILAATKNIEVSWRYAMKR